MTRAEVFRSLFDYKKKTKNARKLWIVQGVVTNIHAKSVEVRILENNGTGKCSLKDITDYSIMNLGNIFRLGYVYQFIVTNYNKDTKIYSLNYKSLHPEEILKKIRPVPTASHFRNLSEFLNELINEYETKKSY